MNSDLNLKAFIKQFLNKSDEIEAKYELLRKKCDPHHISFLMVVMNFIKPYYRIKTIG
jgi:hypothetical protein